MAPEAPLQHFGALRTAAQGHTVRHSVDSEPASGTGATAIGSRLWKQQQQEVRTVACVA